MGFVAFVASVCGCGLVLSLVGGEGYDEVSKPDYHYVPFAGDVFGA